MKASSLAMVVLITLLVGCTSAPLIDRGPTTITSASADAEKIQQAIVNGAQFKGWRVVSIESDQVILDIYVRSHYVKVAVDYSDSQYQIRYVSSENLNYNEKKASIHRSYNRWIAYLDQAIQMSLPYSDVRPASTGNSDSSADIEPNSGTSTEAER
ncbi:hypothetical protein [Umboniibacter marinipuniceus]|uniref:Lipoprotein n=1 Tax=Umboniibacter marinipuniceus TaxID=569599 RepID=A0A3M0ABT0_9GAMM|nr:hypothetical protein [Umboniibacter marinipuniceus]RMA82360.1 hypothetical protein DFR27_0309 [Umboniibacter marinipuniceus]